MRSRWACLEVEDGHEDVAVGGEGAPVAVVHGALLCPVLDQGHLQAPGQAAGEAIKSSEHEQPPAQAGGACNGNTHESPGGSAKQVGGGLGFHGSTFTAAAKPS